MTQSINDNPVHHKRLLTTGFTQMIEDKTRAGWSLDLITIMFSRMAGHQSKLLAYMKEDVSRIYSTFLTRVHRKPASLPADKLPFLIGAFDLPVYKRDKSSAPTGTVNKGLHYHGVLTSPPNSRLDRTVAEHFEANFHLYRGYQNGISSIDVRPIVRTPGQVIDYVLKTVGNGRLDYDDAILVLPLTRSELAHD